MLAKGWARGNTLKLIRHDETGETAVRHGDGVSALTFGIQHLLMRRAFVDIDKRRCSGGRADGKCLTWRRNRVNGDARRRVRNQRAAAERIGVYGCLWWA